MPVIFQVPVLQLPGVIEESHEKPAVRIAVSGQDINRGLLNMKQC